MDLLQELESVAREGRRKGTRGRDFIDEICEVCDPETLCVTVAKDAMCDGCDGRVMKSYSVRRASYYDERDYREHHGRTYATYVTDIPPRNFYKMADLECFIERLHRQAGRTLEPDEITLLLRHITNGRHYKLTCVYDISDELQGVSVYEER